MFDLTFKKSFVERLRENVLMLKSLKGKVLLRHLRYNKGEEPEPIKDYYLFRFCLDTFPGLTSDGNTMISQCDKCEIQEYMNIAHCGSKNHACIHNEMEEIFMKSGICINEAMDTVIITDNTEEKRINTIMWINWLMYTLESLLKKMEKQVSIKIPE